jgi:hypothetical protein
MELGQYDDAAKAAAQATTLRPAVSTDWRAKQTPCRLDSAVLLVFGGTCRQSCHALPLNLLLLPTVA